MSDPLSGLPMLATPKQAAEIMGPTEAQVRGLIRAGRIAHVMVGTRRTATLFSAGAQTTEGEMNADGNVTGRFSCRQRTQVDKISLCL
jgi:hypothetical protein